MIDVNTLVRQGYFQRLNGAVLLDGRPVPVYDTFTSNDAVYPYIILSTQTDAGSSTKQSQGHDATMLVDVVTGFTGGGTRMPLDTTAGQVLTLIQPDATAEQIDVGPELQVINTQLLSDLTLEGQNGVYKIIRRLLRFGHVIHERVNA